LEVHVAIHEGPLSSDAALAWCTHPHAGAVCLFAGVTRDHHGGRAVARLEYEAYAPLALRQMRALEGVAQAAAGGGLVRLWIEHRTGVVPVGEASVVVAASSAHRDAAFAAVPAAMTELKATVAVWKREVYADGAVGAGACDGGCGGGGAVWKANAESLVRRGVS
jgi:molybdopterin synthase catalytic subunit